MPVLLNNNNTKRERKIGNALLSSSSSSSMTRRSRRSTSSSSSSSSIMPSSKKVFMTVFVIILLILYLLYINTKQQDLGSLVPNFETIIKQNFVGGGSTTKAETATATATATADDVVTSNGNNGNNGNRDNNGIMPIMPRTLVIYFPQYHQDPINDKNWGVNFTDWDSLRSSPATNKYNLPIPRPLLLNNNNNNNNNNNIYNNNNHPEPPPPLGYYDLIQTKPRQIQGQLAKKYGIDGFIYHTYWFYDPLHKGPNLAKSLEAMLIDGHPNLPFAFNWCTTKWINVWMGKAIFQNIPTNKNRAITLQEQYFNSTKDDIYEHYLWLKPFFEHSNYIKVSNGKEPIFFLYLYDDRVLPILEILRQFVIDDPDNDFIGIHYIVGRSSYPDNGIYKTNHLTGRKKEVADAKAQPLDLINPMKTKTIIRSIYNNPNNFSLEEQQDIENKYTHLWNYTPFNQSMTYPYPLEYLTKPYEIPKWCTATALTALTARNNDDVNALKKIQNNDTIIIPSLPSHNHPEIIGVVTAFDNSPRRPHNDATVFMDGKEKPSDSLIRFEQNYYVALYYQKCCVNIQIQNQNQKKKTINSNTILNYNNDNRFVAINSWNEWAEGMAIEPSDVYGYQWLEIIQKVKQKVYNIEC